MSPPDVWTAISKSACNPWDMAAGVLLVREAAGHTCDFAGRNGMPDSGNLIAGNHFVAAAMSQGDFGAGDGKRC